MRIVYIISTLHIFPIITFIIKLCQKDKKTKSDNYKYFLYIVLLELTLSIKG